MSLKAVMPLYHSNYYHMVIIGFYCPDKQAISVTHRAPSFEVWLHSGFTPFHSPIRDTHR